MGVYLPPEDPVSGTTLGVDNGENVGDNGLKRGSVVDKKSKVPP